MNAHVCAPKVMGDLQSFGVYHTDTVLSHAHHAQRGIEYESTYRNSNNIINALSPMCLNRACNQKGAMNNGLIISMHM